MPSWVPALKDVLGRSAIGTTNDTTEQARAETETPTAFKSDRGKDFRSGPGATRTRDLLLRRGVRPLMSADRRRELGHLPLRALVGADRRWEGLLPGALPAEGQSGLACAGGDWHRERHRPLNASEYQPTGKKKGAPAGAPQSYRR